MTAASGAQQLRSRRPLSATQPGAADDEERQVGSAQGRPAKRQRAAKTAAQAVLQLAEAVEAAEQEAEEAISLPPTASAARPRQRRQRVLVDTHRGVPAAAGTQRPALEQVDNEYERQRLERIRRNELMLQRLGVQQAAAGVAAASAVEQQAGQPFVRRAVVGRRERRLPPPSLALPVRASKRQRGQRPLTQEEAVAAAAEELGAGGPLDNATASEQEHGALLHPEQYFELIGQDVSGAVRSDGRFLGWVHPEVCERYGIPGAPEEAWEAGGGGQFSVQLDKKDVPAGLKGRGWSDARAFSHTQLQKNPNAYFYRHVAPHEQQAQGEWTEEEHALFVATARQHGVGDKWGLFASHLPQRVGYQCSAYYRDVVIPQGLVIDRRYRMTRGGKAVFVG